MPSRYPPLPPEQLAEAKRQITAMASGGVSSPRIAAQLGLPVSMVRTHVWRLRAAGEIPPLEACRAAAGRPRYKVHAPKFIYGARLGNIRQIVSSLTEAERRWLGGNTPQGMTIAEFVVSIIRDAVVEDKTDE